MKTLLHPTYFPNILTFATIMQNEIVWEVEDNYQKQTFRNRCFICNDQGKHLLSIPIQHVGGKEGRQKYKEVKLDNSYRWQRQHWRTLQTAYRTSPYFEFYEDDLAPLFEKEYHQLLDFNLKTIEIICDCLQIVVPTERTSVYTKSMNLGHTELVKVPDPKFGTLLDSRFLVNAKRKIQFNQKEYVQVFNDRHEFVANASILDLMFNEGPNSVQYLMDQDLNFNNA